MENDEYTFYKCKKNNWSLERKGAYKNIFRVKQRQTIFYFSESQKPLYSEAEQIESAPSKRGCHLGLGCGIGRQNKKMHLFQGRLRGGLFSLSCEVFIAFKSANHWHWWDELDCALLFFTVIMLWFTLIAMGGRWRKLAGTQTSK